MSWFEGTVQLLYLADIRFPLERANGIQTIETCYALAERGHTVTLLVRPDTVTPARQPFAFYGLPPHPHLLVRRARVFGGASLRRLMYLARACTSVAASGQRSNAADAVLTRDLGAASLALRLPKTIRPPVVYESHGLAPVFAETLPELTGGAPASEAKRRRLLAREARVWRRAEGYVTITRGLREDLTHRFGSRKAVHVVPDGVRIGPDRRFAPPCPTTTPTVVFAGHLYPWKGVDVLLGALTRLPGVRARIVGGHPAENDLARLRSAATRLGLGKRVEFVGMVPRVEVAAHLERADVLVMPHTATPVSDRWASPLKLFEYMAAGKPIVASDLAAVREVLRDNENALLVPAGDPEALAGGIARVLGDMSLAGRIARGAYDDAAQYTWARRAERLDQLLGEVVEGS